WDLQTGKEIRAFEAGDEWHDVIQIRFSSDGKRIAFLAANVDRGPGARQPTEHPTVLVLDRESGRVLLDLKDHTREASWAAEFLQDGQALVTIEQLRDLHTGEVRQRFENVSSLACA